MGLDHRRVGEFSIFFILNECDGLPFLAVLADRQIEDVAFAPSVLSSAPEMVVEKKVASVFEGKCFDAGIVGREFAWFELRPSLPVVF